MSTKKAEKPILNTVHKNEAKKPEFAQLQADATTVLGPADVTKIFNAAKKNAK